MYTITGKYTNALITVDNLEESCIAQINQFVNHPAFTNPVAIMMDAHTGKGCCIGFTMKLGTRLIPNLIGVDVGCAVSLVNVGQTLSLTLPEIDHKIRQRIPFGMNVHEDTPVHMKNDFPWHETNVLAEKFKYRYQEEYGAPFDPPRYDMDWFLERIKKLGGDTRRIINALGTLGGGNHMIELGLDVVGDNWLIVHSGSRNLGTKVCKFWQIKAEKKLRNEDNTLMRTEINAVKERYKGDKSIDAQAEIDAVKDKYSFSRYGINMTNLEWLEGEDAAGYLYDMIFCQQYASFNRQTMLDIICRDILKTEPLDSIETVHNFIDFQDMVIRKGAVRSYEGERLAVPLNMRDGVLICTGKGNTALNCSAPHGAGRAMSRSQAKKRLDLDKFKADMSGIFSTSVGQGTIDESPDAYKDSKMIEAAIEPTATIINRIKPILNLKDGMGASDD